VVPWFLHVLTYFGLKSDTITFRSKLLPKDYKLLFQPFKDYLSVLEEMV
jgi:hypothetical protein